MSAKKRITLTQSELKDILRYDLETGLFCWLKHRLRTKVGKLAGFPCKGYKRMQINRQHYYAHRLAWLYIHGQLPTEEIDHIDGVRSNNALSNLRLATKSGNQQNKWFASANNKSGFLGVHKVRISRKSTWIASIKINGRTKHLGCFDTPQSAHTAYLNAKAKLHPYARNIATAVNALPHP